MSTVLDGRASLEFDPRGIHLIEASAGTGKTYTIANLYLRHVLDGRLPADILVVTYTNAATAELKERIHARLYRALHCLRTGEDDGDEFLRQLAQQDQGLEAAERELRQRRLAHALRYMDEAAISTIHGFCQAALIDHAFLSNREFDAEVIGADEALWEQALKDWWRLATYELDATAWQRLADAVGNIDRLAGWLRELRRHPGGRLLPAPTASLRELLDAPATDADETRNLRAAALHELRDFCGQQVRASKRQRGQLAYQDLLDDLAAALHGVSGERLANRLRQRFPVALIDEFQDTDPVQFGIFHRLYHGQLDSCLTLIGDPKQSIYGFRGGDIFTYIDARGDPATRIHSLRTNWRSAPELVDAVNHLFTRRPDPFVFSASIPFEPAEAAAVNAGQVLLTDNEAPAPLTLWKIPLRDNGRTWGVGDMRARICRAVCAEIVDLLGPSGNARIGASALASRDIAILVRDHNEGEEMRAALAQAGIRAVISSRARVFDSDEARGLFDLLAGIAHPRDGDNLRRACASNLFARSYSELAQVFDDDDAWQAWSEQLLALNRRWQQSGFVAMYQQMLRLLDITARMANRAGAERRLTNLGHLAELLQQQSLATPGADLLLAWYRAQLDGDADEASELRLESEADLVRIVTWHKSKGLEYPVVFVPFPWRCRLVSKRAELLRFHDRDYTACFDIGSADFDDNALLLERERLAEDLRLLYVALTRARSKLYVAWGDVGDGRSAGQPKHSALAWLLHSTQTPSDLATSLPDGIPDRKLMFEQIDDLARDCRAIAVEDLPDVDIPRTSRQQAAAREDLEAARFERDLGLAWRIGSFSSLTRDVHQAPLAGDDRSRGDPILDFPAGSHVGLLLHELLEHLDFTAAVEPQLGARIAQCLSTHGLPAGEHESTLLGWIEQVVSSEIGPAGLCLQRLSPNRRLNELKFDLALDHFDADAINRLLQQDVDHSLQPIEAAAFRGLLTGVIDLVFEHDGRFYLADYKSNYLGSQLEDYAPPALARAMLERRYDLQAIIYTLALDRYLATRVRDYDYDRHFGGCYYLFLRAMRTSTGARYGVHFERPARGRLIALQSLFGFRPEEAGTV
ncbi:MAG: UvrD-helicase domain-containing protein [Gammaproteobacteria bacterium]|nr:UvrD-helicase domain-containing protein [Gammaproteobacteria bacterium]